MFFNKFFLKSELKECLRMARPTTSAKLTKGHLTKQEKDARIAMEDRLRGRTFDDTVPADFTEEEATAYIWLCEVLKPADVLGEPDRETIRLAAITIARLEVLDAMIRDDPELLTDKEINSVRKTYMDQYWHFCKELCLSPGARSKIGALAVKHKEEDPLIKVLNICE